MRISSKNLKVYEYSARGWKMSKSELPDAIEVVKLFKAHRNLKELVSKKDAKWLKGMIDAKGDVFGERIGVLPDGTKLDKAFPLFGKHLTIHDESNHGWDVLFQNKGGGWNYVYSLEKKKSASVKKYDKVGDFEKIYSKLHRNILNALRDERDIMAVPMETLMETLMRVGNEMYYKKDGHKGLTTLTRANIEINGDKVLFNFLGKDGVPQSILRKFPKIYIERLKKILKGLGKNDFVFVNPSNSRPLIDTAFENAFLRYCGEKFYPHIVRSYFATKTVEEFLKKNKGKVDKKKVEGLLIGIADRLGHKKFSKKKDEWEISYKITMGHYINPSLIEKIEEKMGK